MPTEQGVAILITRLVNLTSLGQGIWQLQYSSVPKTRKFLPFMHVRNSDVPPLEINAGKIRNFLFYIATFIGYTSLEVALCWNFVHYPQYSGLHRWTIFERIQNSEVPLQKPEAIQCVSKPGSSFSMIFNVCPNFKVPLRLFFFMRHTRLAWPSCNSTKRDVLAASAQILPFQICMLAELVLYSRPSTKCGMGIQQENFKTPGRITLPWLLRAFSWAGVFQKFLDVVWWILFYWGAVLL